MEPLVRNIPGLSTENVLSLLNLAASLIEPSETYLEIGTWKGLSLVGAMLGNDRSFVAIDEFADRSSNEDDLRAYLSELRLEPTIHAGDAIDLIRKGALDAHDIGACFYDADHAYGYQLETLRILERHLAPCALLVIDDADWPSVARAVNRYVRESEHAEILFSLRGERYGQPGWWHGLLVIAWRPVVAPPAH